MFPIKLVEFLNEHNINTVCWVVSALTMISAFRTFEKIKPISAEKVAAYGYKKSQKGKRVAVVGFGNKVTTFLPRLFSRKFVTTIAASTTKKEK